MLAYLKENTSTIITMSCVGYHCYVRELYINSMESAAWHIIYVMSGSTVHYHGW